MREYARRLKAHGTQLAVVVSHAGDQTPQSKIDRRSVVGVTP